MMTYVGAPMIYYGDEVGMWGANDPCCRKPMVWDDLAYEPETHLPDGTLRQIPNVVEANTDLLETYKTLIHIRHRYPALRLGDFQTLLTDDENQIYVYQRSLENQTLVVALNNTRQVQRLDLETPAAGLFRDVLHDSAEFALKEEKITLELKPLWGVILINQVPNPRVSA